MSFLDKIPLSVAVILAMTLGLAPVSSEPHLWEKLKMLAAGELRAPVDIFDLALHGVPWLILLLKLVRLSSRRG